MERLIVDRLEGLFAVCEKEDRSMKNIPKASLPDGVVEGSCLIVRENGSIELDMEEYKKRKDAIEKMMEELFN